jgi:uncharacterized protein with LGFP repeats
VSGRRGQLNRLVTRALVSLAAVVMAAVLLTPVAMASPIGEAEDAMMAAWDNAGGDNSPLGARKGDVYPLGAGFALDFAGGKMYFTKDTGAKFVYGPILEKYEALGGPAGSDLGFPTISEIQGLAGPDSRMATFAASDKPVMYWTLDHGAFVVRGALNAAWDKLGSSGGELGVPVGDETYDGDVASQKFSRGAISWNRKTKQFTTEPAAWGDQLKDLQIADDPAAAINMAWRAAGGANGPLGARKGGQYPIGRDGIAQDFAGGRVYYSTATGANALESDILAKYEPLGGPVSSALGFPIANESDGGIAPSSRIAVFSGGPEKPVIFWTPDHGAFVVRGAMKAAWDKLKGPTGKLGAPVGDQSGDGDVFSQNFTGGKITWNRETNTFTTDPPNLAPLLTGLQVPGQNQPSGSAMPVQAKKSAWHRWYLLAAIPLLVLLVLLVLVLRWSRRRRSGHGVRDTSAYGYEAPAYEPDHGADPGYDVAANEPWAHEDAEFASQHHSPSDVYPAERLGPEEESPSRIGWPSGRATTVVAEEVPAAEPDGHDLSAGVEAASVATDEEDFEDLGFAAEDRDPDNVDTDSIPVQTPAGFPGTHDNGFANSVAPEAGGIDDAFAEAPSEDLFTEAGPDAAGSDYLFTEEVVPETEIPEAPEAPEAATSAASVVRPGTGRHAAADTGLPETEAPEDEAEVAEVIPEAAPAVALEGAGGTPVAVGQAQHGRPTIHLPLDDPYQAPDGYPIKASASFGMYYPPSSTLYDDMRPEIWLASEEVAEANGFTKAD